MKRVFLLFGGLYSFDGVVTSAGMYALANDLKMPDVVVKTYAWANYRTTVSDISEVADATDKIILIGYSDGGWRATTVANLCLADRIDLIVLYDPSPSWNMEPIHSNVKKAYCYQNSSKMFIPFVGMIGGGILTAKQFGNPRIDVIPINQQHLAVQFDSTLHTRTVNLVKNL